MTAVNLRPSLFIPLLLLCLFFAFPVFSHAQDAPDYSIRNIRARFSPTLADVFIEFDVNNDGATATQVAIASARVINGDLAIAQANVAPIVNLGLAQVSLPFSTRDFAGRVVAFIVTVDMAAGEAEASATLQNNSARISVDFSSVPPQDTPPTPDGLGLPPSDEPIFHIGVLSLRANEALIILVGAVVLLLVLLLSVIVRLLFRRPPEFGHWQPPYLNLMPLDPNTSAGRRQQWQPHAQNHLLPPFGNADGQTAVRKVITRVGGKSGHAWQIGAVRICPFDAYGRVGRGVVLSNWTIKRINTALNKHSEWTPEVLEKKLRPVSQEFVRSLKKRWTPQTVMLPLALDIGLQGKYGEAGVQFELAQWTGGRWQMLDTWHPDMPILGKKWREQYTYTVYGQRAGETAKDFHARLEQDLTQLLAQFTTQHLDSSGIG